MPAYTPPPGGSVTLEFGTSSYTPPNGASVTLEFEVALTPTIYPGSIVEYDFGSVTLKWTEYIAPSSIGDASSIGTAEIDYKRVLPTGIESALDYGTPRIWLAQQWLLPSSIVVEMQAGHQVARDDWYVGSTGSGLTIEFGDIAYAVPPGSSTIIEFEPGVPGTIYPRITPSEAFGSATIQLGTRFALPASIYQGDVGTPEIYNLTTNLSVPGTPSTVEFGMPTVEFLDRTVRPVSVNDSDVGTQIVSNYDRGIDLAGNGPLSGLLGTHLIAYRERFVWPAYIFANAIGTPTIGFDRVIEPAGEDHSAFGAAEVRDNSQTVVGAGMGLGWAIGEHDVALSVRSVYPTGYAPSEIAPSEQWGRPEVYNLAQFVYPVYSTGPDFPEEGGVFGQYTLVENRNRTMVHYGHQDSKVSKLATIENTGRALLPSGIDGLQVGEHLVADGIRSYQLDGIDSPWFSPYHAVHNAAAQVLPTGILPADVGTPAWSNPPQAATFVGHIDSQEHGTPFVDFAIRSIVTPLGPEAIVGMPDVQLGTRYLTPDGLEATKWGATYVYEHFNIAAAHSIMPPAAGEPWVRNVTPEVTPYGYEQTEWGLPEVRWNPWPVSPDGLPGAQFGALVIRDRRQTAAPSSIGAGQVSTFAQVRNDTPDPPAQQVVAPAGGEHSSIGTHAVVRNEIEAGGAVFTAFGTHEVRLIGAIVPGMAAPEAQIPSPTVSGPRTMSATGIRPPDDPLSGFTPTKHDLSPRTIWATFDVTDQALENHPGAWVLVDDHLDTTEPRGQRPFWGTAAISLASRIVSVGPAASGMSPQEPPAPAVESTIRTIYPAGRLMQRFGVPTLPGPQTLELDGVGFLDDAAGLPAVENFDKDVLPVGAVPPGFGDHEVQHFHREVLVDSLGEGPAGTPRVHPPEPVIPGMGVQTLWGDAMVADRIRRVYPSGWDSFTTGEEIGGFGDRMRVMKRYPLRPVAISDGALGEPRVSSAIQTIEHVALPAPGRPPAPEIAINTKIALGGLGLWYEGHGQTVITHGDNMEFVCGESSRAIPISGIDSTLAFGSPSLEEVVSLVRRLYPVAIDPYDVGAASVSSVLAAAGISEWAIGSPSATYQIFVSGIDESAIGTVSLAQQIYPESVGDGAAVGGVTISLTIAPSGWLDEDLSALYVDAGYFSSDYVANDSGVRVTHG